MQNGGSSGDVPAVKDYEKGRCGKKKERWWPIERTLNSKNGFGTITSNAFLGMRKRRLDERYGYGP